MTNSNPKLFMLDNLDSFTYNLVDEFKLMGFEPVIYRNTLSAEFIYKQIAPHLGNALLVISPGPGTPSNAGCLMQLLSLCVGKLPILGICLGHQALVQHYGGVVGRAPEIVHGKSSLVEHSGEGAFANIANPVPVARYHSLVATSLPTQLTMSAHYQQLPMAIENKTDAILGFQFHPESILTTFGSTLLHQSVHYLLALGNAANQNTQGTVNHD